MRGKRHWRRRPRKDGFEREREVMGRLKPTLRLLLETATNYFSQLRGDCPAQAPRIRWLVPKNGGESFRARAPREWPRRRHRLVEHAAERKDVRPGVRGETAHLLRRHVPDGPQDRARLGRLRHCTSSGVRQFRKLSPARETEVENLCPAGYGDENVLGLQIPMNDAARVRGRESVRQLDAELRRLAPGHL